MLATYSLLAVFSQLVSPLVAHAQLLYPTCDSSWSWSYNTLEQSPCAVAAYLQGVCDNGVFSIPDSVDDVGPAGPGATPNLCQCNTVVYSLMSACDACQGADWLPWNTWIQNCTVVDPPQTFSNTVPNGTRVPEWAFTNVTMEGIWDPVLCFQYGNQVEISPGEPATMTSLPAPTTTQTAVPGLSSSQAQFLAESKAQIGIMLMKTGKIAAGIVAIVVSLTPPSCSCSTRTRRK